jgi:sugar/nucleoside kinase (ribokinase family)
MSLSPPSIIIVGAATLDRLLHVNQYPVADSKALCTTYESGGGNAANTASGIGRLQSLSKNGLNVKLLSKVSSDQVGDGLVKELQDYGVDLSSPLFIQSPGRNPVVTIIVTNSSPYTRTCLCDTGTVGTLTVPDLNNVDLNAAFENVTHLHSDTRYTDVALSLVQTAKRRTSVPVTVSVDVERDRYTQDFDDLIDLSDLVFTNEHLMQPILIRRLGYNPFDFIEGENMHQFSFQFNVAMLCYCLIFADSIGKMSSTPAMAKELIVTKGGFGAIHCTMTSGCESPDTSAMKIKRPKHFMKAVQVSRNLIKIVHSIQSQSTENDGTVIIHPAGKYEYTIHMVGPPMIAKVVDTTGAGDAFIAGYIVSRNYLDNDGSLEDAESRTIFNLQFASWVAGKKIGCAGARVGLPTVMEVEKELGNNFLKMAESLQKLIFDAVS